jgi:arginase
VEAAPVAYLNERYAGDLAVVWLDAHGDLNTPGTSPSGNFHGMVLRTLLGDGPAAFVGEFKRRLHPRQVFLASTRDLDPAERDFIVDAGISVTLPGRLSDPAGLVGQIAAAGFRHVYVHLDLDALDPATFGDTLIPTPGGPPLPAVADAIAALAREFAVVGASVLEYVHGSDASLQVVRDLVVRTGLAEHLR